MKCFVFALIIGWVVLVALAAAAQAGPCWTEPDSTVRCGVKW